MTRSRTTPNPQGHAGNVAFPWLPAMQAPTIEAALRDAAGARVRFRRDAAFALRDAAGEQAGPAVAALCRLLDDPDGAVRALALESLGVRGAPGVLEAVLRKVDDGDEVVRAAAVEAVAALAASDPAPVLELVRHEKPDVRAAACGELGGLGGPGVEEALVGALGDEVADVRSTAAAVLGWWYPGRHTGELRGALEDADLGVRLVAADHLAWVGDDAGREVLLRIVQGGVRDEIWEQAFARLVRVARPEEAGLLASYGKWPTRRRRRALALAGLARLGDESARFQLRKWLGHPDPRHRGEALLAVGYAGAVEFQPELEQEIARPGSPLFQVALLAAVQMAEPSLGAVIVRTAGEAADRGVFEELSSAAADLARVLGDGAPRELVALAGAEFGGRVPDDGSESGPEPPDA
ncbi:MAG: HEAT repeat domain-containing protein [Deltaproteobacteria bacterium]|nr:HEAT repeat domain-containing protein [Deltaproteobacteria bacterium]